MFKLFKRKKNKSNKVVIKDLVNKLDELEKRMRIIQHELTQNIAKLEIVKFEIDSKKEYLIIDRKEHLIWVRDSQENKYVSRNWLIKNNYKLIKQILIPSFENDDPLRTFIKRSFKLNEEQTNLEIWTQDYHYGPSPGDK